jgi:hypothetical protein
LIFGYCILFLCGIKGVGGEGNIDFIDFGDVGKHTEFGGPLLVQLTIFAVLTDEEEFCFMVDGTSCFCC